MKKIILSVLLSVLFLQACGSEEKNQKATTINSQVEQETSQKEEKPKEEKAIEVDKGILHVTITLPASLFKGENIDDVISKAKEQGVQEVTKNTDGSLTYKISKSEYNKMMQDAKEAMVKTIDELQNNQNFKSIKGVEYNDSFSEFTLTVEKETYQKSFDGFAALGIGISSMYYQAFGGVSPEENKTKINLKDISTGDIFDTVIYPDAINNIK